jgi:hypothetical protein
MNYYINTAVSILRISIGVALQACARTPEPPLNAMNITWCDTEPMKPLGRIAQIPNAVSAAGVGTLTGVVTQRETGDALPGAGVRLVPIAASTGRAYSERYTDNQGGFTFDSVTLGRYQIRVRHINEYQDSASFEAVGGRVDTIKVAMRAYRCHGY